MHIVVVCCSCIETVQQTYKEEINYVKTMTQMHNGLEANRDEKEGLITLKEV